MVHDQHIMGSRGPVGLRLSSLRVAMDAVEIDACDRKWCIQLMRKVYDNSLERLAAERDDDG